MFLGGMTTLWFFVQTGVSRNHRPYQFHPHPGVVLKRDTACWLSQDENRLGYRFLPHILIPATTCEEYDMNSTTITRRWNAADVRPKILRVLLTTLILCGCVAATTSQIHAGSKTCGSFYLRNDNGDVINPLSGENGDQPFSTRKTCGACHDYDLITKGYHFQQGWDRISDSFNKEKPWELSDGMMGKH